MKLQEFMRINHITDFRQFFHNNLLSGTGPVAMYSCPKCDDIINDPSAPHMCTPEDKVVTDGMQGVITLTTHIKLVAEKDGFAIYCGDLYLKSNITKIPSDLIEPVVKFAEEVYKQGFQDAGVLLMNSKLDVKK